MANNWEWDGFPNVRISNKDLVSERMKELQSYKYKIKESKMTRKEALKKLYTVPHNYDDKYICPETLVGALEALGLLKLDEPKLTASNIINRVKDNWKMGCTTSQDISDLLDIIENKCDDIKCVTIGKHYSVFYKANPFSKDSAAISNIKITHIIEVEQ